MIETIQSMTWAVVLSIGDPWSPKSCFAVVYLEGMVCVGVGGWGGSWGGGGWAGVGGRGGVSEWGGGGPVRLLCLHGLDSLADNYPSL